MFDQNSANEYEEIYYSYYILKAVESLLIMDGTSTNVADIQLIAIMG